MFVGLGKNSGDSPPPFGTLALASGLLRDRHFTIAVPVVLNVGTRRLKSIAPSMKPKIGRPDDDLAADAADD
jgi:hypothetical protein